MTLRSLAVLASVTVATVCAAVPAQAVNLVVVNASFETLPAGGLPLAGCGAGCSFSTSAIPGWVNSGGTNGQFQPGSSSGNFAYFDYVPDGATVAYTNGGSIVQTLTATAVAGHTYSLFTDFGVRHDVGNPGSITLSIGATNIGASGAYPTSGTWSTYSAVYTATAADAGAAITVTLGSSGGQGDFDNVRVTDTAVPEPATWALMLTGFGLVGAATRRRVATAA